MGHHEVKLFPGDEAVAVEVKVPDQLLGLDISECGAQFVASTPGSHVLIPVGALKLFLRFQQVTCRASRQQSRETAPNTNRNQGWKQLNE